MDNDTLIDLAGQVALITGAGQGAGKAIALTLARQGAGGIAVNDYIADRAHAVAEDIRASGVPAIAVPFDAGDIEQVRAARHKAEQALGAVTILVNNAGNAGPTHQINMGAMFWEEDPSHWEKYLRTNLHGVFNCSHTFLPAMVKARGGRIVTIVSDAGRVGEARLAVYSAAKAGAAGFMRAIAREAGRWNITCNCIALSTLMPPLSEEEQEAFLASDAAKAQLSRYIIRRYGKPDDVAALTAFLCSQAASWITGQTYPLNGGYSLAI